jgi:ribose-phosphate pyrophosphokinase
MSTPAVHNIEIAVFDKSRKPKEKGSGKSGTGGSAIVGDVDGAQVYELDDMISTFGTATKAGLAVAPHGGALKAILATHGLFCGDANDKIAELPPETRIVIADTVNPWRVSSVNMRRIEMISTCEMVAGAIERIHYGTGSISELLA